MQEKERNIVSGLVLLLLILWMGFLIHRDPRFAGTFAAGMIGVAGAVLMLVPLAYMIIKRVSRVRKAVTRWISMRTLLAWHIYAGTLGPILAIIHSGHKFNSTLGIALTAMMLMVVISGFVGRYLMNQFSQEIREKKSMLTLLEVSYRQISGELMAHPEQVTALRPWVGFWRRLIGGIFIGATTAAGQPNLGTLGRALRLADSIADLEYAIKTHETFKTLFAKWLRFHIVISFIFYGLLALHIWAGIHFGLRWFE